jgi:lipopolysaccharide/colanic/teichoic acid biosynthesis glycosyltransferase
VDVIQSCEDFHRLLKRERAGCDRNAHEVSLLVFDVATRSGSARTRELVRILARRIRQLDEIGWFDAESIGVLLPYTSSEGAHTLAADVCGKLAAPEMSYTVYTYPARWFPDGKPSSGRGGRAKTVTCRIPVWKRALDILGSLFAFVCLAPLLLVVACIIKLVSPGPIFFKQTRIGQYGQPFTMWKFRTMRPEADAGLHQSHLAKLIETNAPMTKLDVKHDPRIIPFGRLMRRCCVDEFPQLFNVLRGEMSLVGPRPCLPYETAAYQVWQTARFDAAPGMTGLWQVSGKNKTTFTEMIRLDIRYARELSPRRDLAIVLKTVPTILAEAAAAFCRRSRNAAVRKAA